MKIVCLGDSLTYGYLVERQAAWPHLLGERRKAEVANKGVCGDTSAGILARFQADVVDEHPSQVIIMAGTNDLIWHVPLSVIEANLAAMVFQAYQYNIQPFLGVSIPVACELAKKYWTFVDGFDQINAGLAALREWIFAFSQQFDCRYIDFYSLFFDDKIRQGNADYYIDGLHPTRQGHRMMAELIDI